MSGDWLPSCGAYPRLKSQSLAGEACTCDEHRTFCGLTSRCAMPSEWMCSSAVAMSRVTSATSRSVNLRVRCERWLIVVSEMTMRASVQSDCARVCV
jgi:hypothetical protein